mmetsp:Transcript_24547/g.41047  ORF Transcript_24547/g.41047 Transcript_24547/m.41047 type:complete len:145 (-) Transcript_24547:270-704(-)|eukprot:CAMPEP_0198212416 /NCGR_PEP_ID=MMETSP1445-20131203/25973_1 /TAXON_ID=36898 /ORGANISM="Pyramimonas sp., Strain CCMP2087" /LENGTH=144 /DNA_ID=CAMNT_0043886849 /DNA_START=137 /DNA_END=571 /DNA_ORIENTATION=+
MEDVMCPMTKKLGCSCGISISPTQAKKPTLKSEHVFKMLGETLKEKGPEMVKKLGGVIVFKIEGEVFTLDLKNAGGSVAIGKEEQADLTVTVSDENFIQLTQGQMNPQIAFMTGKLKLKGNMGMGMKLGSVLKMAGESMPKAKL